jgi:hypothetical protein
MISNTRICHDTEYQKTDKQITRRERRTGRRDWERTEWAQTDPHGYWSDAACEPAYYLEDDADCIDFCGWWEAYLDDELPAPSAAI